MIQQILFIQGGGHDCYESDKELVASLQSELDKDLQIKYPEIISDESAPDFGWVSQIKDHINEMDDNAIIVAHSLGASMLLKFLSENQVGKKIKGIFLIATPFWSGNEEWKSGLKLQSNFATKIPADIPLYFYHSKDDAEVPFSHLGIYKQNIPQATFRELQNGGHQLLNNLAVVADDFSTLQ